MEINEKIMVLRKRKGYSQEDLAHELDVSRQAVYKWESGESTPELDKIKKTAAQEEFIPNFVNPFRSQSQQPQFSQAHNQSPDESDTE